MKSSNTVQCAIIVHELFNYDHCPFTAIVAKIVQVKQKSDLLTHSFLEEQTNRMNTVPNRL